MIDTLRAPRPLPWKRDHPKDPHPPQKPPNVEPWLGHSFGIHAWCLIHREIVMPKGGEKVCACVCWCLRNKKLTLSTINPKHLPTASYANDLIPPCYDDDGESLLILSSSPFSIFPSRDMLYKESQWTSRQIPVDKPTAP